MSDVPLVNHHLGNETDAPRLDLVCLAAIAAEIKRQVFDFKPHVPLVVALR